MVMVIHRKQQTNGITLHPKKRTCNACKIVFKSKLGLKSHQRRVSNPGCHRAGILRMRAEFVNERRSYEYRIMKGLITCHDSVYVKHDSTPFTADSKQICLNVYQKLRDKDIGVYEVCICTILSAKYDWFFKKKV